MAQPFQFAVCLFKRYVKHREWLATGLLAAALILSQPMMYVSAHQIPPGCTGNKFTISILKDKTQVRQGDTLTYTVTASNIDAPPDVACDITDATITLRLPAADGTPTGQLVTLETNRDFPSGTALVLIGTVQYVVNVNEGVVDIVAEASGEGVLHDAPVDHTALIVKTIGTSVVWPDDEDDGGATLPTLPNTGAAPQRE